MKRFPSEQNILYQLLSENWKRHTVRELLWKQLGTMWIKSQNEVGITADKELTLERYLLHIKFKSSTNFLFWSKLQRLTVVSAAKNICKFLVICYAGLSGNLWYSCWLILAKESGKSLLKIPIFEHCTSFLQVTEGVSYRQQLKELKKYNFSWWIFRIFIWFQQNFSWQLSSRFLSLLGRSVENIHSNAFNGWKVAHPYWIDQSLRDAVLYLVRRRTSHCLSLTLDRFNTLYKQKSSIRSLLGQTAITSSRLDRLTFRV